MYNHKDQKPIVSNFVLMLKLCTQLMNAYCDLYMFTCNIVSNYHINYAEQ